MNRDDIIEAMFRAWSQESGSPEKWMAAALTALETAIPGLADVISGKAYFAPRGIADGTMHVLLEKEFPGFAGLLAGTHVIVPVEPTEAMIEAAQEMAISGKEWCFEDAYRAMIEARPK